MNHEEAVERLEQYLREEAAPRLLAVTVTAMGLLGVDLGTREQAMEAYALWKQILEEFLPPTGYSRVPHLIKEAERLFRELYEIYSPDADQVVFWINGLESGVRRVEGLSALSYAPLLSTWMRTTGWPLFEAGGSEELLEVLAHAKIEDFSLAEGSFFALTDLEAFFREKGEEKMVFLLEEVDRLVEGDHYLSLKGQEELVREIEKTFLEISS